MSIKWMKINNSRKKFRVEYNFGRWPTKEGNVFFHTETLITESKNEWKDLDLPSTSDDQDVSYLFPEFPSTVYKDKRVLSLKGHV